LNGSLLGIFLGLDFVKLSDLGLGLVTHNTTTPVLSDLVVSEVVVGVDCLNQLAQRRLVLIVDISDGNTGAGLAVNQLANTGFTLDNAVWDSHLFAQGWKAENDLNWFNIVGNDDKLSFLLLNHAGNGLDTASQHKWFLRGLIGLAFVTFSSTCYETNFFLLLGLWLVLLGKTEQSSS